MLRTDTSLKRHHRDRLIPVARREAPPRQNRAGRLELEGTGPASATSNAQRRGVRRTSSVPPPGPYRPQGDAGHSRPIADRIRPLSSIDAAVVDRKTQVNCWARRKCNGFLNRVSQVRILLGAPTFVQFRGHLISQKNAPCNTRAVRVPITGANIHASERETTRTSSTMGAARGDLLRCSDAPIVDPLPLMVWSSSRCGYSPTPLALHRRRMSRGLVEHHQARNPPTTGHENCRLTNPGELTTQRSGGRRGRFRMR